MQVGAVRTRARPEVLLIEEDAERCAELRAMLEQDRAHAWRIAEAVRPEHVRPMLTRDRPFVIALGLDADETDAAHRVRTLQVPGRSVPVVAVVEDVRVGLRAVADGADDFVVVDRFDPESSRTALGAVLGRQYDRLAERAERRALKELIERVGDALIVLDPDLAMVYVNPEAERLFENLSGRAIEQVLAHARDAQPDGELEVDRTNGATCRLRWRLVEGHWGGEPARFVLLREQSGDVQAFLLDERIAHTERLAAVGTMAAGVAHEINNPLATVIGLRDLAERVLQESSDGEDTAATLAETAEMLADMREGLERIRLVVRDLAQFSRGDHGHAAAVDLDEVVRATCHLLGNQLRHRAELKLDLGGVPALPGVRNKIAQVVTNLLLNAMQAVGEGHASANRIRLRTWVEGDQVRLMVEDTGCGIPSELRSRVFEPFFTTKAERDGTGLGLALCSQIMKAHGGRLWFESTVGVGTRFFAEFPTGAVSPTGEVVPECARALADTPDTPRSDDRPRVLAIDDEPGILELLELAFEEDYDVVAVPNGARALALLEQGEAFDAVLCDLMMPDVDGIEIFRYLERSRPELARRTIFLSGGAFSDRSQRFLREQKPRLIEKPFRFERIGEEIEAVLKIPGA